MEQNIAVQLYLQQKKQTQQQKRSLKTIGHGAELLFINQAASTLSTSSRSSEKQRAKTNQTEFASVLTLSLALASSSKIG
jgi:hypothetical protein